jgi:hypothetical protein
MAPMSGSSLIDAEHCFEYANGDPELALLEARRLADFVSCVENTLKWEPSAPVMRQSAPASSGQERSGAGEGEEPRDAKTRLAERVSA